MSSEGAPSSRRTSLAARARRAGVPFRGPIVETGRWTRRIVFVAFVAAVAFLGVQAVTSVFQALDHATRFSGYALDGAFQLYNPLRRLADGQLPGRDFPFFHGVGMPWIHYPLYVVFGQNIFASEMSRWLLSPVMFAISGGVFLRALLGTWTRAVIGLAVMTAMSNTVPQLNLVDPGNSMIGIRSMTVLFIAAAMLWPVRRQRFAFGFLQANTPLLIAYALLGVSLALGSEQGVAAIGAFLLVRFFQNVRRLRWGWRPFAQSAVDALAAVSSVLVVLTILTGGSALSALRYALVDIPADQGWVFGSIPNVAPTADALVWDLIGGPVLDLRAMVPGFLLTGLVAVVLVVIARRMRAIPPVAVPVVIMLFLAGLATLAALLGYISLMTQLAPFGRLATAVAVGAGTAIVITAMARTEAAIRSGRRFAPALVARPVAAAAIIVAGVFFVATSVAARTPVLQEIPKREVIAAAMQGPTQDDYEVAGPGFRGAMDAILSRIPPGADIWATYSSLFNSQRDVFVPAPGGEDYIIHALGAERREAYENAFDSVKPEAVITTNPNYTIYEEWLWGRYPQFYATLFQDYTLTVETGSHLLWLRNEVPAPRDAPTVQADVQGDGTFSLPGNNTDRVQYYELTVQYVASGGDLPIVNRLPRFYLDVSGSGLALSGEILPPDETSWSITVPVLPGSAGVSVSPYIGGVARFASLDVTGAEYRQLDVAPENDRLMLLNYCSWNRTNDLCTG
ncbi:hypothetical protein ACI2K6_13005 [Microbacterium sp. NPDC006705]|uniref:hypothetical protein n=1 Tax=Microbacterium sp. NPDC006705 TaxID=3364181 RepID=UPI00384CA641